MKQPDVRVGVLTEKEIRFDLYGDFFVRGQDKKFSGKYTADLSGNMIVLYQEQIEILSAKEISFIPSDLEIESFLLHEVVIGINFHWQKKENQRFRGELSLIIEEDKITAVNILPLEDYLTSVISSEMSPNSSLELMKAHAIVSRGWLLAQLAKKKTYTNTMIENSAGDEVIRWYDREDHKNYDFCADDHCQRYQGITKIINDHASKAICDTYGLFLTYNEKICDTRYSKSCGGVSEEFESCWEDTPHKYLSPIVDYKFELDGYDVDLTKETSAEKWIQSSPHAFCNTTDKKILSQVLVDFDRDTNDFFRWKVEYTQEEIAVLINNKSGFDFGDIFDLIPVKRGASSRLVKLKIIGSKKALTIGKELEIRKVLSKTHLYSSAFIVQKENIINGVPQKFILLGAGWGHGVGLCQIGAAVMGEKGYTFDEILKHYFRGATIQKGYE
ncbi:MAG: putative sporulation protein [Ignavibacteria bacterium]|nr:MAG: putative sporulation protein [Ignavibacteria bacterium]KAF0157604.1 MAG: putative sporulation protein [Ignavibacteria bacterium]